MAAAGRRLQSQATAFLLCDLQEKLAPVISYWPSVMAAATRLLTGAKAMNIPVIATEQNPARLGKLVGGLDLDGVKVYEKTLFSMCVPQVHAQLQSAGIKSVVLFGVETHVCVYQTALDLLEHGYDVYIAADGCSSRFNSDRLIALDAMRQQGAIVSTSESILFQLLRDAQNPAFKAVSAVVKPTPPDTGLLRTRVEPEPEARL